MRLRFKESISLSLARNVVLVALSLSLVLSVASMIKDLPEKQESVRTDIDRVINAVRWPAAEAVYNLDPNLVGKAVRGLIQDPHIHSVVIIDDFGTIQFSYGRAKMTGPPKWLVSRLSDFGQREITLFNPWNSREPVGLLRVGVDDVYIAEEYLSAFRNELILGFIVDLLMALILILVFHVALTRPLLGLTHELSRIDPNASGQKRLSIPKGHERDELGRSITAVNRLLSRVEYVMERRRQAEKSYLDMFQSAPVGLFKGRVSDGKVLELNEQLARMYGFDSRQEFLAASFRPKEHMKNPELRDKFMEQAMSVKGVANFEAEFVRVDGSTFWGRLSGRRDPGADVIDGILEDITERKMAEERYRILSENAPVGIAQVSPEGGYIYANRYLAEMYGYDSPEDLTRTITDIRHQLTENSEHFSEMVKRLGEEGFRVQFRVSSPAQGWGQDMDIQKRAGCPGSVRRVAILRCFCDRHIRAKSRGGRAGQGQGRRRVGQRDQGAFFGQHEP